jgi:hypothetical protein
MNVIDDFEQFNLKIASKSSLETISEPAIILKKFFINKIKLDTT